MSIDELRQLKADSKSYCKSLLSDARKLLDDTDERLFLYCHDVIEDADDTHNLYEVLAVEKFLRFLGKYTWDKDSVQNFIRMYESLKFNGLKGRMSYKMTPVQVFQFSNIFGFLREDGTRLCRFAILFVPRKFGKTTSVASLAVRDIIYGDSNSQAYMAANSESQSSICFRETKSLIQQLDPEGKRFRITASEINWRTPNAYDKEGLIQRLTAGGRTKDGLNASLVIYDEYAAARYVKDHSDGAELLNVLTSSMGTRLNPLTVIITTASRVPEGPFTTLLADAKQALIDRESDWQFASIFCPDEWELDEDSLSDPRVWKKCNPHIGVTILPNFYADEYEQARRNPEKMKEFHCKYLNVFESDRQKDWISYNEIKSLSVDFKVDDFSPEDGWLCFMGMDFSKGDDLNCQTYLCYHPRKKQWFMDCDAWITEKTLNTNTNGMLYKRWADEGWLHVCPGDTIDEMEIVKRTGSVFEHVNILQIGYDPYDAKRFVNALYAWVDSQGGDPGKVIVPVKQTWGNFNSSVQEMAYLVNSKPRLLSVSPNPLIAWCFGNCVLEEDKYENVKPVKRSHNSKIDIAICALEAIILQDNLDAKYN